MADTYQVVTGEQTPITIAGQTKNGYDATVQAIPSGVGFHVVFVAGDNVFSDPQLLEAAIDAIAGPYSGYVNHDVTVPGVVTLGSYQDLDNNQNSVTFWEVTVSATANPDVTATVTLPFTDAIPDRFEARVDAIRASLDQVAPAAPTLTP